MIDITQPVFFYDDRSKTDMLVSMDVVLFHGDKFVLCTIKEHIWEEPEDNYDEPLLFNIETGDVLNGNYDSWCASNEDEFIQGLRDKFATRELEQKEYLINRINKMVPPLNKNGNIDGNADRSRPLMMAMPLSELQTIHDDLSELIESGRRALDKLPPERRDEFIRLLADTDASKQALEKLDTIYAKARE